MEINSQVWLATAWKKVYDLAILKNCSALVIHLWCHDKSAPLQGSDADSFRKAKQDSCIIICLWNGPSTCHTRVGHSLTRVWVLRFCRIFFSFYHRSFSSHLVLVVSYLISGLTFLPPFPQSLLLPVLAYITLLWTQWREYTASSSWGNQYHSKDKLAT